MDAEMYEAFQAHLEKLAYDEAMLDAFHDELEKIAFVGALGGALRGGFGAAKGVARKLWSGQSVGGVSGALKSIRTRAGRQAGQHGTFAAGAKPMRAGVQGPAAPLSGVAKERALNIASKNRMVGGAALGTAGLGGAYMMSGGGQRRY